MLLLLLHGRAETAVVVVVAIEAQPLTTVVEATIIAYPSFAIVALYNTVTSHVTPTAFGTRLVARGVLSALLVLIRTRSLRRHRKRARTESKRDAQASMQTTAARDAQR